MGVSVYIIRNHYKIFIRDIVFNPWYAHSYYKFIYIIIIKENVIDSLFN